MTEIAVALGLICAAVVFSAVGHQRKARERLRADMRRHVDRCYS